MKPCNGNVFQVQRWSVNDGEGIRSTVFLKGCPLRCRWCANPESWRSEPEILYFTERCTGCGQCAAVCETGAITLTAGGCLEFDRTRCVACGRCANVCPNRARNLMGSRATVEDLLRVIRRDAVFYRESGGGVTFSGGEPFGQPEFLRQAVLACKALGLDTAVETSGYFSLAAVQDIFTQMDCVFWDVKHMDDAVHRELTGVSNRLILRNLAAVSRLQPRIIVRVPLIDGVNATADNIQRLGEFLQQNTRVREVELLAYHDLGGVKRRALGEEAPVFAAVDETRAEAFQAILRGCGLKPVSFL